MKTKGMTHQDEGVRLIGDRPHFALFCEQGTGKTWMFLAVAEQRYARGQIDALLIVAPKGVHINWIKREIPAHLEAPHIAAWYESGANKTRLAQIERLFQPRSEGEMPPLRVLAMNFDAVITKKGRELAERFLNATRAMMVVDESHRIKNPSSARTKALTALGQLAVLRFIGSGTPITNAPIDAFAQFEFLESGLLGTTSYRSFVAEYAELVPEGSRLMEHIKSRSNTRFTPQVIQRDSQGRPKWRNIDKLNRLVAPLSYRVLKRDCLDLPEKIYQTRYFELTPSQRRVYEHAENELRIEVGQNLVTFQKMNVGMKLQQITSGFVMLQGSPVLMEPNENPRLETLLELVDDIEGPFIVWARFVEEIKQVHAALAARGVTAAMFYGDTKSADRTRIVDDFQGGKLRAIVGQAQSGGIGLTLTAATNVVYYSNDWSLENRLQSEDRAHRIGTRHNVVYTDIAATDTVDETIARALQRKEDVASAVLGDFIDGRNEEP